MPDTKTQATDVSVGEFVEAIPDAAQRADAHAIAALMERLSDERPYMWGSSIVGFGRYHYKYESGREGDAARIGFSPRKGQTVLYLVEGFEGHGALMARLGKHKTGKSCLYVKRLSDIDLGALEELIGASLRYMDTKYPKG